MSYDIPELPPEEDEEEFDEIPFDDEPAEAAPLSYPAPNRCRITTEEGWCSREWTLRDVLMAKAGGAWFAVGQHEFDSALTADVARRLHHEKTTP